MTPEQRNWLESQARLNQRHFEREAIRALLQERDALAQELATLRANLAKVTTPATLAHVATQDR